MRSHTALYACSKLVSIVALLMDTQVPGRHFTVCVRLVRKKPHALSSATPQAAADCDESPRMQCEIHNPAVMPVPGIRVVTVAVPADGHWEVSLQCNDSGARMCPS